MAADTPIIIKIDTNNTHQPQAAILPIASENTPGGMSPDMVKKLNNIPVGGETLSRTYDNGISAADQTANISAAKGGPIIAKAASVAVGSLLRALTSVGGVVLDAIDGAFPQLLAPGIALENKPGFGAPQIRGNDSTKSLYVTADGVGALRGGSGIGMMQDDAVADNSFVVLSINDVIIAAVLKGGLYPTDSPLPTNQLGGPGTDDKQSWLETWSQLFATRVGAPITVASTISPTFGIHPLVIAAESDIHFINLPLSDFTGTIRFLTDNVVNFLATGTSNLHQSLTTTPGIPVEATYYGSELWLK